MKHSDTGRFVLGDQQYEAQRHRQIVGCIEFQWGFEPVKRPAGILQALDATVWDGDPAAERGRAEAFTFEQAGKYVRGLEPVGLGEQFCCVFKQLFLAGKTQVQQGCVWGDEGGDQVHAVGEAG